MRQYTVLLTPDPEDGGFVVAVPALPGCVTQADTYDEALSRASEAIAGHIEALQLIGETVPEEQDHPRLATVAVA